MRKAKVILALTLALTLVSAFTVQAGPVLDRILKRGELLVGTSGGQPPLTAKTKDGRIIGLDADLAEVMAGAMGVKLKMVDMPFAELLPALEADKVDMVISGMTMTPKRNLKVAFVGPYYISGKGILTKTETVARVQNPDEINAPNFTLVALKNSTSQAFVEKLMPKAKLVTTKTLDEALDQLFKDKADAIVADYPYCAVTAYRYQAKGLTAGSARFTFEPLAIAIPDNDLLLLNWVQNVLLTLQGGGALEALTKRWFENASWIEQLP